MRDLKVGDVLIAKDECRISSKKSLIIGKEYPVLGAYGYDEFFVKSEIVERHYFLFDDIDKYFTLKDEPKHPESETLRDKFAMAAMNGLLSADWKDIDMVVSRAYLIADEMLKARNAAKD